MPDIAQAELDTLRQIKTLMDKAWSSKEHGASIRKALKAVDPNITIPDEQIEQFAAPVLERATAAEAKATALEDRLNKMEAARTEADETSKLRSALADVRKTYNFDDEGLSKVIARMRDKNNPDVESAAAFVARSLPKPEPVRGAGVGPMRADINSIFGMVDPESDMEGLHKDPVKWADNVMTKILNEPAQEAA